MTWLQPASRNISALMEPVKAPEAAAWQSWPPSATPLPASASPPSTSPIGPSSVAGGQTSRSQACGSFARSAMARASAMPSARRPFIFQLPATSSFRSGISVLHAARASAPANVAAMPGDLYVRTYDHTGIRGGQPAAIPAKSGILRHDASDPHQSGLDHRQGPVRALDHLVRVLGHLYAIGLLLGALARYRHRCGRRAEHPRRRSAARLAARARAAARAIRYLDRPAAGQAARDPRHAAGPADRPQPDRPGSREARPRSLRRGD